MWVTKLLISPLKKRIFAQIQPNLAQNWHFLSIWAGPCRLIRCPVGGSVGGCGARAVSRKTPIYFIIFHRQLLIFQLTNLVSSVQRGDAVKRGRNGKQLFDRRNPSGTKKGRDGTNARLFIQIARVC